MTPVNVSGLDIQYGGDMFAEFELPASELLGILAAVIILLIAFGSVLAMGLPIGTALFGLGAGSPRHPRQPHLHDAGLQHQLAAMIGLGVGIDYALFIVTRYREALHLRSAPEERDRDRARHRRPSGAVRRHTVDDLAARHVPDGPEVRLTAWPSPASLAVLTMMLASVTLLPALLGFAGTGSRSRRGGA